MTDFVMPGDKLGFIEEIEGGSNTFDDGDTIRASAAGISDVDKKAKTVQVRNGKQIYIVITYSYNSQNIVFIIPDQEFND